MKDIEPLNTSYNEKEVISAVSTALTEFYTSLTNKLNKLDVDTILKRKNI